MNSIVALGFVCLIALQANGMAVDDFAVFREKCSKELGLAKSEISSERTSEFFENPKAPCYLKCLFEANHMFKPNDSVDVELTIKLIDLELREQARPLIIKCVSETDHIVGRCEKSLAAFKCVSDSAPTIVPLLGILELPKKA